MAIFRTSEMKNHVPQIFFLIFVSFISISGQTNSWKNLIPLHSTRTDVEKLFGKGKEGTYYYCFDYETEKEYISVCYSTGECKEGWNIPKETVLSLRVSSASSAGKSFEELKLDKNKFSVSIDDAVFGKWTNPDEGLQYYFRNGEKELISITYIPKKSDNNLRCNGFAPFAPEGQHFTFEKFLFYNPGLDKKEGLYVNFARADGFLINLSEWGNKNEVRGYVLVYFDNKLPFKDYQKRLNKLKEFIFKTRKADPEQVTVIEGGMREESLIEFYILWKDWKPPAPNPTLPSPQFMRKQ